MFFVVRLFVGWLVLLSIRRLLLLFIIGRVLLAVVGLIYFKLRIIGTLFAGDLIRLSLRLIHLPQGGRLLVFRVIGFVGGIASDVISQFQYGYEAGVAYANSKLGKNVTVSSQYAESFSDAAKGKSIANKMFLR